MTDLWKCYKLPGSPKKKSLRKFLYVSCIVQICLWSLILMGCQSQDTGTSNDLTVVMTGSAMMMHGDFTPRELHITVGQTVTWINKADMHHSVTADDDSFNSGFVAPGASYSLKFTRPGRYPYHCVLHGSERGVGMAGVIIVEQGKPASQTSPGS